jgi:hypothetical protein
MNPNGGELAGNAARALEHYRALEHQLELEIATRQGRLDQVREFIAALTATPRGRKPRAVEQAPEPEPPPDLLA